MLHKFLENTSFHILLTRIDDTLAEEVQQKGCPYCGGKLHYSDYPRSPFGVSAAFRDYYQSRRSFCCAQCRKRTTSPSVRFFGRRWYYAPFFILINALIGKASARRLVGIQRYLGLTISKRTWRRWRKWWHEYFPTTSFWKKMKGLISIHAINGPFPRTLLSPEVKGLEEKVTTLLQFLAPITAGALRAV